MLVSEMIRLASFILQQAVPALMQGRETIEVEDLGDEHRAELAALIAYRDSLDETV